MSPVRGQAPSTAPELHRDWESRSLLQGLSPPVVHFIPCFNLNHFKAGTRQGWRFPELHPCKNTVPAPVPPGRAATALPCSCSACTSSTAKPRKGRKTLQKAEIETASFLLSVLSKESGNEGTKANTDYSNNLFNPLLLPGKDQGNSQKKNKKGRGKPCVCVVNKHHAAVLS